MRAVKKSTPSYGAVIEEIPIPTIKPFDALVKVKRTSICGTDYSIYAWDDWAKSRIKTPHVMGHEFCGEVVEIGSQVTEIKVGDYVSAETHINCGVCYQCRTQERHICKNVKIIGVDTAGSFADYIAVPAKNLWVNDKNLPLEIASLQEPFGNAVHTVLSGKGVTGKIVAVFGCGLIGIMAIGVARASGAETVIAIDINDYRLQLAEVMNPTLTINSKIQDPYQVIMDFTHGEGIDFMVEMSGSEQAITTGLKLLRNGGEVALLGLPKKPIPIDLVNNVIFKGSTIYGINGRKMFETWYQVRSLLQSHLVDLSKIITHRFTLDNFEQGMKLMEQGKCGKVVLEVSN